MSEPDRILRPTLTVRVVYRNDFGEMGEVLISMPNSMHTALPIKRRRMLKIVEAIGHVNGWEALSTQLVEELTETIAHPPLVGLRRVK